MDTIQLLGSTLGLGFVAGIRLYLTVLALGLAIRLDWLHLAPGQEHLAILAHPAVLGVAGVACVIELIADKAPWVDSVWDSFHTFIRPIGAVVLAAMALGSVDPALRVVLTILCGGIAFGSHSSKAGIRLLANHSPEPFSNIALSVFEDLLAAFGIWLALEHPVVALALVLAFVMVFAWVAPRIFRLTRLEVTALWAWIAGGSHAPATALAAQPLPAGTQTEAADALRVIAINAEPLPAAARLLNRTGPVFGIRCAATKEVRGLRNSIGYLVLADQDLVFVARRLFRRRVHRIGIKDISLAEWKRGLLMNRLLIRTAAGHSSFYVFRNVSLSRAPENRAFGAANRLGVT